MADLLSYLILAAGVLTLLHIWFRVSDEDREEHAYVDEHDDDALPNSAG